MSYLFQVILLLIYLYPSQSRSQARIQSSSDLLNPSVNKHKLKGNVKLITQVQSPITNKKTDWLDGYSGQNYTEEYNRQGFLLKRIARDDYNVPQRVTHYEYTSSGTVSALWDEEFVPSPLGGRTEGRLEYAFDSVQKKYVVWDKRIILGRSQNKRTETTVDSLDRISLQRVYEQDTLLIREKRQKWDAQGYLTERAVRFRNQQDDTMRIDKAAVENFVKNELTMNLSESEKKALERSIDSLNSAPVTLQTMQPEWSGDTVSYKNQYDNQAKLTRQESYKHNQITQTVSLSYTSTATRVLWQHYNKAGELTSEDISLQHPTEHYILSDTRRSKNNDKWETMTYNANNYPKPVYHYKYDTYGNWIEQKQVDSTGKQTGIALIRIIEYYP